MNCVCLPADSLPFMVFLRTFNQAYADYLIPMNLENEAMRRIIHRDKVDLAASRVVLCDEKAVGVGMLAREGAQGWIGGVGILPAYRGRGLGRRLMESLLDSARQYRLQEVRLEVIVGNTRAENLYLSLGFHKERRLLMIERPPAPPPAPVRPPWGEFVSALALLQHHPRFHAYHAPWQRRLSALQHLGDSLDAYALGQGPAYRAYALGWFWEERLRFMDVAGHDAASLRHLLIALHRQFPDASASYINLGADESAWTIFQDLGYHVQWEQQQMLIRLGVST